jgi:hypothetical protein
MVFRGRNQIGNGANS